MNSQHEHTGNLLQRRMPILYLWDGRHLVHVLDKTRGNWQSGTTARLVVDMAPERGD